MRSRWAMPDLDYAVKSNVAAILFSVPAAAVMIYANQVVDFLSINETIIFYGASMTAASARYREKKEEGKGEHTAAAYALYAASTTTGAIIAGEILRALS